MQRIMEFQKHISVISVSLAIPKARLFAKVSRHVGVSGAFDKTPEETVKVNQKTQSES